MPWDAIEIVKTRLHVSTGDDDDLLTELQSAAESYIEDFCGRSFAGGTFTEFHSGGAQMLFLKNYPVLTVESLRVDPTDEFLPETARAASSFIVHAERGVIENKDGPFVPVLPGWRIGPEHFPNAVRVVYTTIEDAVPGAVQRALVELVAHWYRQAKTNTDTGFRNITLAANASGETGYAWGHSTGFKLPPAVEQLLQPYRVPAM